MKKINARNLVRKLRRIVKDDTGAVMMEYVLVAMLVAAASVAAVSYFGRDVQGMFGVTGRAIWADSCGAIQMREKGLQDSIKANIDAQKEGGKFSTLQNGPQIHGTAG